MPIVRLRAQEVGALGTWAAAQGFSTYLATFTVRHAFAHELAPTLAGLALAWRRFCTGDPWQKFKADVGFVGAVRAAEVTHGAAGWHPHLHVLFVVRNAFALEMRADNGETNADGSPAEGARWLAERWAACAARVLGEEHRPDLTHGVKLTVAYAADYVAKMGLELTDVTTKEGKRGSRSPWQIASDAAKGDAESLALWVDYSRATHGHRQLTWTRGLRELARIADVSDQMAASMEADGPALLLADIDGRTWRALYRAKRVVELLEAAETTEAAARVARILTAVARARDAPEDDWPSVDS